MPKAKILVVDDEQDVVTRLVSFIARKIDCSIEQATSGEEALSKLKSDTFDLVIIDIKMPGLSGIDVMREAKKFTPQTAFLAISGYDSHEIAGQALQAGAVDFVPKPQTPQAIELKIKDILGRMGKYEPKKP
jgi:YesN/AraC family two-component response regulator